MLWKVLQPGPEYQPHALYQTVPPGTGDGLTQCSDRPDTRRPGGVGGAGRGAGPAEGRSGGRSKEASVGPQSGRRY